MSRMIDWLLSKMPTVVILLYLRVFRPCFYDALCRMSIRERDDGSLLVGYGGKFISVEKSQSKIITPK